LKRVGGLWPQLVSRENLFEAAKRAAAGKRKRGEVARFWLNLEQEVLQLERELVSGAYQPGRYRSFWIEDPKRRLISAAPFRDRVVHHALTQVLEPVFEVRFHPHAYASRKGKGVHAAIRHAEGAARKYEYVLKCDIRKYFASMDHEILMALLGRSVKCKPTLELARRIVAGSNEQEESIAYFEGDLLWTPYERRHGLPLGNQTSQFFGNVYLNALDQYVGSVLKPGSYLRYVDDFALFGNDKRELGEWRRAIESKLAELRLRLHAGKSRVYRVKDGVTMLGWKVLPDCLRLKRENVQRMRRKVAWMNGEYGAGRMDLDGVRARVMGWLGHSRVGGSERLRESVLDGMALVGWHDAVASYDCG